MMRPSWLAVLLLGCATLYIVEAASARETTDPLVVLCAGAAEAPVYVAPLSRIRDGGAEALDASELAFHRRWYRGVTPLRLSLPPGEYIISVGLPARLNMHEAMLKAAEFVWDGFNQHAIVLLPQTNDWRYFRCYVAKKIVDQPLTVISAFEPPGDVGQCMVVKPVGEEHIRFTGTVEQAWEQLEEAGLPVPFRDIVVDAALTGHKVLLTTSGGRWAVYVESLQTLSIRQARAVGISSGRRLSVLTPD